MYDLYVSFQSLTQAQIAAGYLRKHGIDGKVVRAPIALAPMGCSFAVKLNRNAETIAKERLALSSLSEYRFFRVGWDAGIEEVYD